jgi:hypothetical protein
VQVQLGGNIGVFGKIEHVVTVNLPTGVQAQLDRMEASLTRIEGKIDDCCPPPQAARLIVTVGTPFEQP